VQLDFRRLQCTPDLMPSDITGISVYNSEEHKFHFIPGPVFTHILLADEINRATPRTQSALLEAMAEGTVTIDRETNPLPDPFMVIATQNPVEFSGTYPLPEAQLDRFFMRISLGYPDAEQEQRIMLAQQSGHPLDTLEPVLTGEELQKLQTRCEKITISREMVRYISDRMAVMYLGTLMELGPVDDVYFTPLHPYTQVLVASNPEPDPDSERARVSTEIDGEIPSPVNVPQGCRFAGRCPKVMDVCRTKTPPLKAVEGSQSLVACHLY
jgi:oligopeptide/dipeptide ABC transporter ATP-binding protein